MNIRTIAEASVSACNAAMWFLLLASAADAGAASAASVPLHWVLTLM